MNTSTLAPPPPLHSEVQLERLPAHRLPNLPAHMLEPEGLEWGIFTTPDNAKLRWCCLKPASPWADVVIAMGFREFIEKYFELIHDLAQAGLTVWCIDWRGQGLSDGRGDNPARAVPRDFKRDVTDLAAFTQRMLSKTLPRFLIAHSMGGAIGLRTVADHPTLFKAAVFSAPMIAVRAGVLPRWLARLITRIGVRLGFGSALIPGTTSIPVDQEAQVEFSRTSHDPIRCTTLHRWYLANPLLKLDGVTFGWYDTAASASVMFDNLSAFKTVNIPILIGTAGQDVFVHNAPIQKLAHTLPHATLQHFPQAKHELFNERDDIRSVWMDAVITFLRSNSARPST